MKPKKHLLTTLLLLTLCGEAWADEPALDTIFVNDGTSYLILNHKVYAYGLGNERDFLATSYENCLMIRAVNAKENQLSSVFVSYGDSTYL